LKGRGRGGNFAEQGRFLLTNPIRSKEEVFRRRGKSGKTDIGRSRIGIGVAEGHSSIAEGDGSSRRALNEKER